nr:hypothetical protein BaRGS_000402 [Batillaria attramentaria]
MPPKTKGSVVDDEPSVVDADGEQSSKDGNGSGTESEKMHTGFMQTGPKSYRCGSTLIELDDADEDITVIRKNNDIALEVECGENQAIMYLSKLYQGSKGQCIEFPGRLDHAQRVSGRQRAGKRQGLEEVHPPSRTESQAAAQQGHPGRAPRGLSL